MAEDLIAEAITAQWGERCPDFDDGCVCCQAWAQYDALASREAESLERAAQVAERAALMSYAPYQHPENIATAIRALIPAPLAGKQEGR